MKVLITGGHGDLGASLSKVFKNLISPTRKEMDVTNPEIVEKFILKNKPDVVIHAAALVGIRECEENKELAWKSNVMELSSVKAAEATKIMENTFRDVNIAFVNEMAKSFDKAGIDILEVIKGASTKPFAFMPHYPGAGVGGHCIPVDPYYLIEKARQMGFEHEFLSLARKINNNMPHYTVELLENELKKIRKLIKNSKVGVLGLAYKANVDDIRESPAFEIIHILKSKGADVFVFDPHAMQENNVKDVDELLNKSDYLILATDHDEFRQMDLSKLEKHKVLVFIDGRNCMDKDKIKSMGILYHGIGRR